MDEEEEKNELNIISEVKSREREMVLSSDISPEKFTKELFRRVKDPDKWTIFTGPYSILISEMPEFNLKARRIKPTEYLQECPKIETEIRGKFWWIRRRRG